MVAPLQYAGNNYAALLISAPPSFSPFASYCSFPCLPSLRVSRSFRCSFPVSRCVKLPASTTIHPARAAEEKHEAPFLQDLKIPEDWMSPARASQESDWLKRALHEWLDNEYCPEPSNEEISSRCAKVYYYCLMEKQTDMGDILLQMIRDLESFSFKESFHGAFSSANAAVDLIIKRIYVLEETEKQ